MIERNLLIILWYNQIILILLNFIEFVKFILILQTSFKCLLKIIFVAFCFFWKILITHQLSFHWIIIVWKIILGLFSFFVRLSLNRPRTRWLLIICHKGTFWRKKVIIVLSIRISFYFFIRNLLLFLYLYSWNC